MGQSSQPGSRSVALQKSCAICGVDCNGRPRVKDPSGRYFCHPCYESRAGSNWRDGDDAGADVSMGAADALHSYEPLPPTMVAPGPGAVPWTAPRSTSAPKERRGPSVRPGVFITNLLFKSPIAGVAPLAAFLIAYAAVFGDAVLRLREVSLRIDEGGNGQWSTILLIGSLTSVLGALVYWLIAPFFYRLRLKWSGGDDIEASTARIVYMASAAPAALCSLGAAMLIVLSHDSPKASVMEGSDSFEITAAVLMLGLLALGCIVTFLTAWQAFDASPGRAAFWFLAIPLSWYALQVAALVVVASSGILDEVRQVNAPERGQTAVDRRVFRDSGRLIVEQPKLTQPQQFSATATAPYEFSYPGNWTTLVVSLPNMEFQSAQAKAPDGSMFSCVLVPPAEIEVDEEFLLDSMAKEVGKSVRLGTRSDITALGRFKGHGRVFEAVIEGRPTRVTMFVRPVGDARRLIITSVRPEPDGSGNESGFDLILQSLKVISR